MGAAAPSDAHAQAPPVQPYLSDAANDLARLDALIRARANGLASDHLAALQDPYNNPNNYTPAERAAAKNARGRFWTMATRAGSFPPMKLLMPLSLAATGYIFWEIIRNHPDGQDVVYTQMERSQFGYPYTGANGDWVHSFGWGFNEPTQAYVMSWQMLDNNGNLEWVDPPDVGDVCGQLPSYWNCEKQNGAMVEARFTQQTPTVGYYTEATPGDDDWHSNGVDIPFSNSCHIGSPVSQIWCSIRWAPERKFQRDVDRIILPQAPTPGGGDLTRGDTVTVPAVTTGQRGEARDEIGQDDDYRCWVNRYIDSSYECTTGIPEPDPPGSTFAMPDCHNLTAAACEALLQEEGHVGTITTETLANPQPGTNPNRVHDTSPFAGTITGLNEPITIYLTPSSEAFTIPQPNAGETYLDYLNRLRGMGWIGTVIRNDADETTTTAIGVPNIVTGTNPAPGTTVTTTTTITITATPPTWNPTWTQPPPPGYPGPGVIVPPTGEGDECDCPPINWAGLQVGATDKFPFGLFAWLGGLFDDALGATAAAPSYTITAPAGVGNFTVNFAGATGFRNLTDPVVKFVVSIASVWWLCSLVLGLRKGDSLDD